MPKITTADCKNFLVAEITKNPRIIHDIYEDTTTAINEALVAKNWIREYKVRPDDDVYTHDFKKIAASKIRAMRRFVLDPGNFDTAVCFIVLEDTNGNLILGEYVGD